MAEYYHGVRTRKEKASVSTPVTAGSAIAFFIGTAPVHTAGGKSNLPIMAKSYEEAVSALGYSDDWKSYTLCEAIYSQFKLYGVAPVIFVNVLDPEKHKTEVLAKDCPIIDRKVKLPIDAIDKTVVVRGGEDNATTYAQDTDYALFYQGENLVVEALESGSIPTDATTLNVAYSKVDPSKVTKEDIIGGFDVDTKTTTGLELIDSVFPRCGIAPDLIVAPGWSHFAEVAAVMAAKAEAINGIFKENKALIDMDTSEVTYYRDAPEWKKGNGISSKAQIICWPKVKYGSKTFHLSTQLAGLMGQVDAENGGCPCESPSNKKLQADGTVLENGEEVLLDVQQANYLNANGIVTAINFYDGFVLWGNETACFPDSTDETEYFIPVGRMFGWVAKSVTLTYWSRIDRKLNRRLLDSIVDALNIWLNGLVAEEKLLGGRVEFQEADNDVAMLMRGKAVFRIYLTPPSPAKELEFVLEYDVSYIETALAA